MMEKASSSRASEERDLQTILALYDSSDLLSKLEDAAKVFAETLPGDFCLSREEDGWELEELLDDALAVVGGDLSQLLLLGLKDTANTLHQLLDTLGIMVKPDSASVLVPVGEDVRPKLQEAEGVENGQRQLLFTSVIYLFKHWRTYHRFLALLDDEETLEQLYLSFAPMRNKLDRERICRALKTLPHISNLHRSDSFHSPRHPESPLQIPKILVQPPSHTHEEDAKETKSSIVHSQTVSTFPPASASPEAQDQAQHVPKNSISSMLPRKAPTQSTAPSSLPDNFVSASDHDHNASYFTPPKPGQTLINYLQSQDTETCADLERENAHFFISEAIIAAMEQMQYERRHSARTHSTKSTEEDSSELESDVDEQATKHGKLAVAPQCHLVNDSSSGTASGSLDEDDDVVGGKAPEVASIPIPLDPAEKYWRDHPSNSAEFIAISLLRKFNELTLPKASEVEWIVSETDAPQSLLPLPKGTCITPDSASVSGGGSPGMRIRGNLEWAPLRPQIIYHLQPHVSLKVGIASQKQRCAGCGGKMDAAQQARMRYCEYTGKYFCVCCHEYKTSLIPAKILLKWDFTKHYVSNFAADFIARIFRDPLFDVSDCNLALYKRSKSLAQTRLLRTQLVMANDYVRNCRDAASVTSEVQQLPKFVFEQVHTYSLEMFTSVRDGMFPTFLKPVADIAVAHVLSCKLCRAKGFICEFCRNDMPIFPFQLSTVYQCKECSSCFHNSCIKNRSCPKCARLQARKQATPAASVESAS